MTCSSKEASAANSKWHGSRSSHCKIGQVKCPEEIADEEVAPAGGSGGFEETGLSDIPVNRVAGKSDF